MLEGRIREHRGILKERRAEIKAITEGLNAKKAEIDALKTRLDRKEEERKVRLRDEQLKSDDMFEEQAEEIIDEEELVLLRKMKDLKKVYRDSFGELKNKKGEYAESQKSIDLIKEQLISAFEAWYAQEFESANASLENAYHANLVNEMAHTRDESIFGGSNQEDEDAQTFMRAKRKVETLARAKRIEKQVGPRN